MTTALQIFTNEEFGDIRVVMRDGEPWFVATDVCRALDISNTSDAIARLDDDEKGVVLTDTLGGKQSVSIISEAGLYTLVLSSRKPEAKKFKRWITHEVVPSIRKTGSYSIGQSNSIESSQYTPATNAATDVRLMVEELQRWRPGVKEGIAFSLAIDIVGEMHNAPLQPLKQLLPPAEHTTGHLNATQIGKKLGGIPPQTVNKTLERKAMQYKDENGDWRLTEAGRAYGEEMLYTRNGHSGYQVRWHEDILDVLKC